MISITFITILALLLILPYYSDAVAPVVSVEDYALTYSYFGIGQSTLPVADHTLTISNLIELSDADSTDLKSATIAITTNFIVGDILISSDTDNIVSSFTAATGILTLTGTDTVANYQAAMRLIEYKAYDGYTYTDEESSHSKTMTFTVVDDDTDTESVTVTRGIFVSSAVRVYTTTWYKESRVDSA